MTMPTMKSDWRELEDWINTWLPDGTDLMTLDGDSKSAKQRLRDIFKQALSLQKSKLIEGVEKMKNPKWENTHGYNLALEDVIKLLKE